MRTPALIIAIAGVALIIWGLTSTPQGHKSFLDGLNGNG